jgi:hypothetical protein
MATQQAAPKKAVIMQDELNPVPVEILAASITRIDEAARKLLNSGLTKKRLITLLHYWCNGTCTRKQIETCLDALANLRVNLRPKKVVN